LQLVKLIAAFFLILSIVSPVNFLLPWGLVFIVNFIFLFVLCGMDVTALLKRNVIVLFFSLFWTLFIAVSIYFNNQQDNYWINFLVIIRLFMVYNAIVLSTEWLGKNGFLYIITSLRSERIKLYLLLLNRSIGSFRKIQSQIMYQIQSRLDLKSREKYLIPRYYTVNIISKELYSFQHYQAALLSRLPDQLIINHTAGISKNDFIGALGIFLVSVSGLIVQFLL